MMLRSQIALLALLLFGNVSNGQAEEKGQPWTARADVIEKFEARRGDFNYQESKIPEYQLPDPLISARRLSHNLQHRLDGVAASQFAATVPR